MTNQEIFDKIGITMQINEDDVPSRKEQRKTAKSELEGTNPATFKELVWSLHKYGFAVNFGVKLYKGDDGEFLPDGESAYVHAKVMFNYLQTLAIRYKYMAIHAEIEGKKSATYKKMIEARTAFYDALKDFCGENEAHIDRKCTAADCESISTFAARFTFYGADIKEGVKYTRASLTNFAMQTLRYLFAGNVGIESAVKSVEKSLVRLTK